MNIYKMEKRAVIHYTLNVNIQFHLVFQLMLSMMKLPKMACCIENKMLKKSSL